MRVCVYASVCLCLCVYRLTFECDLGSSPLLDLQSALLTCRHTPQVWRAANVPLIPATAALLTVISNFSLDQRFMMTGEMLSIPSGWC